MSASFYFRLSLSLHILYFSVYFSVSLSASQYLFLSVSPYFCLHVSSSKPLSVMQPYLCLSAYNSFVCLRLSTSLHIFVCLLLHVFFCLSLRAFVSFRIQIFVCLPRRIYVCLPLHIFVCFLIQIFYILPRRIFVCLLTITLVCLPLSRLLIHKFVRLPPHIVVSIYLSLFYRPSL